MTAPARIAAALSDRLNGVLVKEVRQALRGNYFRWTFWTTLSGATLIAVMRLMWEGAGAADGQEFFQIQFACLALAVHAFVPFSAFMAMGGEWEENTYDLLCLSNLKPRQIVLGKVLAAGVQAALYYCAFGPFLVFSFLLKGIDPLVVALLLAGSLLLSLCLSTTAVAISTLSAKRPVRMLLQALLAGVLFVATVGSMQVGFALSTMAHLVRDREFAAATGVVAITLVWITGFAFAAAVSRLAHSEENASTPGRVWTLLAVPWTLGGFAMFQPSIPGLDRGELALLWFGFGSSVVFANSVLFASERERLGRRVRTSIPSKRSMALLSAPLLPGGGRGLVFFVLGEALLFAGLAAVRIANGEPLLDVLAGDHAEAMGLMVLYGFTYLAFAPVLVRSPERVGVRRVATLALIGAGAFLPTAVGFFVGSTLLRRGDHAGNPVWGVERAFHSGPQLASLLPLFVACAMALVLSLRRVSNGFGEVLDASRENAKRGRDVAPIVAEGRTA